MFVRWVPLIIQCTRINSGQVDFRDVPAEVLLEAAKAGAVWMNVRDAMNIHPEYKLALDSMYGELAENTGNCAFNPRGSLLISDPVARPRKKEDVSLSTYAEIHSGYGL